MGRGEMMNVGKSIDLALVCLKRRGGGLVEGKGRLLSLGAL